MKSAYEIALARMEAEVGPARTLTDDEKNEIAEIEKKYAARAAETRLGYESRIASAAPPEQSGLSDEMSSKLASLEEKLEAEKNSVWSRGTT